MSHTTHVWNAEGIAALEMAPDAWRQAVVCAAGLICKLKETVPVPVVPTLPRIAPAENFLGALLTQALDPTIPLDWPLLRRAAERRAEEQSAAVAAALPAPERTIDAVHAAVRAAGESGNPYAAAAV